MNEWQPIETAPTDEPHLRALWVYCSETGRPLYFGVYAGFVDDRGDFVDTGGHDDHGWRADDFDWWAPLPELRPEPPK